MDRFANRRTARKPALALAVAAAAFAVAAPGAADARVVAQSNVTISNALPLYHGKVKSSDSACEKNRKVRLYRKHSGKDLKIGSDTTNAHGRWRIMVGGDLAPGRSYYAKVGNDSPGPQGGTGLSCIHDKSKTVTFVGG